MDNKKLKKARGEYFDTIVECMEEIVQTYEEGCEVQEELKGMFQSVVKTIDLSNILELDFEASSHIKGVGPNPKELKRTDIN